MKRSAIFLIFIISVLIITPVSAGAFTIDRTSGDDRFETAAAISQKAWPDGADAVVIAQGRDFPDALAGAPLAYYKNGPLLLTESNDLLYSTAQEIERLNPGEIIILGGTNAVSRDVEGELERRFEGDVTRISGKTRYGTAAAIADYLPDTNKAMIVNGERFPDAMASAPYASRNGIPILLTTSSYLPEATVNALGDIDETILVGGSAVIGEGVEAELPRPWRIAGEDRYATSAEVARKLNMGDPDEAYVATGLDYADALAGSAWAANTNDPILLVEKDYVPNSIKIFIDERGLEDFHVLGGYKAVDQYVDTEVSLPTQMLLVNKERGLPADYKPDRLVEPDVPFPFSDDRPKRYMSSVAAGHLERMINDANSQGLDLYAKSGYRSYERQKELHDYYTREYGDGYADRISAEPGHSEHQTGLAMDVTSPAVDYQLVEEFADTAEGRWVEEHAAEYGFITRYPEGKEYITGYKYEPWHLRYVGVNAAKYMDGQNWTLETYLK